MSAVKRKYAPNSGIRRDKEAKKNKRGPVEFPLLETEIDSDPIHESDTTEHSGDDDGVSWPSEDDENALQDSSMGEDGGAQLPETTSTDKASNDTAKNPNNKNSSKEAHAKQKVVAQERKAAKPNADSIARSKKIWERLRRKSHVPLAERKELVLELFEIITGRVKDFVFKHDSVRVIQTALIYANLDQRRVIARELKGAYRSLAESRYAKFLVGKIIVHGDKETRDLVVPEFFGHVRRMIRHPEASWILDDIYRGAATPIQKSNLLHEWYGAEFAIFKNSGQGSESADLKELLGKHPEKRKPIMHALHELINGLVQKRTTGFTMLHDAMLQYFLNVEPFSEETTDFIELLKGDEEGDLLKNLAFTRSGARVVCLALAYGNAKDRKQILKTYKNTFQTMAYDRCAHQVLLAIYDVIDDTVLMSKTIVPELIGKNPSSEDQTQTLLMSAVNLNARIPLLYPFCGKSKAIIPNEDLTLLDELHSIRSKTSKKNPEARRKELVASLSPPLLMFIAENLGSLVPTSFGCQFITEILLDASGDRAAALNAIAALAHESPELLNSPAGGRMLKTLVLGGRFNPACNAMDLTEPPLGFHNLLYASIKDEIGDWATGANSFVIVGLWEAEGFSHVDELRTALEKKKKLLKTAAVTEMKMDSGDKVKGKKSRARGNRGAQVLLEKLGG